MELKIERWIVVNYVKIRLILFVEFILKLIIVIETIDKYIFITIKYMQYTLLSSIELFK